MVNQIQFRPILCESLFNPNVMTIQVYAVKINQKCLISKAVTLLSRLYPSNTQLAHLKRVRRYSDNVHQIIITNDLTVSKSKIAEQLSELGSNEIDLVDVPAVQPITRSQFENCSKIWPTNFHEDKLIARMISDEPFDKDELMVLEKNFHALFAMSTSEIADIALVTNKQEILSCGKVLYSHPLKHAIMSAIENIAAEQVKCNSAKEVYLCTDFDVWVNFEPCVMCCMALLHSRIKRLFLICGTKRENCSCPNDKALSNLKLHLDKRLNHHYQCWLVSTSADVPQQ